MRNLLFTLGVSLLLVIAGCSNNEATPQERMKAFLSDWQKQNFAAMYEKLSNEAKRQISKDAFIERYETIYKDFEIRDLTVSGEFEEQQDGKASDAEEDGTVQLPFKVEMDSLAGPISFSDEATLVKEVQGEEDEDNWYVNWTAQMIFPQMTDPDTKVRARTIPAKRGKIIDREGRPLAVNGTVATIGIWPGKLEPGSKKKLAEATGIPADVIEEKLDASWVEGDSFVPVKTYAIDQKSDYESLLDIPGVRMKETAARTYPYDEAAAHLTGFIADISAEELKKRKEDGYDETDQIGQRGLEALFENRLRGEDGGEIFTIDEDGERLETIAKKEPENGETIQLTIDAELQRELYEEMKGDAGTAAAINPKTGEVLALVSTPAFDPNQFIMGMSNERFQALQEDPQNPLLNRFKQAYSPGSAFKPITAAIGLESGAIDPAKEQHISGKTWQPEDGDGWGDYHVRRVSNISSVDLRKALVYSDNIYFAQAALNIGPDAFLKHGKAFGFGEDMPFPYPIETSQITSNGEFDSEIQLANTGYGQGKVMTSALHLSLAFTPFLNEGNLLKPILELEKAGENRDFWHESAISSDTANTVLQNLIKVVESPDGTGHNAHIDGFTIAGKTGTAELKKTADEKDGKENGWFVGFNTDKPEILVTMMIEDVGDRKGSAYVVPKVGNILKQYLK